MRSFRSIPEQIHDGCAEAIALRADHRSLTYAQLNAGADRLTAYLMEQGLMPGAAVAVCLPRSFAWVTANLAVMRAGASYVPMDLAWPTERLRLVAADCGATHMIAPAALQARLSVEAIWVDPCRDADRIAAAAPLRPRHLAEDSLAYIIYTSGSTGVPKGVEISHNNLAHLVAWHGEAFAVSPRDRASHLAGLSFDAAGWEVWPYLAAGAAVSLVEDAVRTSPELLQRWLLEQEITISFIPTAVAAPLIAAAWPESASLRYLLTGGDTLHRGPGPGLPFAVVNNYGPTECTVVATSGVVSPGKAGAPPIGWPIAGTDLYLLDESGHPVPQGRVGEICISGPGVGRGYHNRPEETAARFVPDPFLQRAGQRMYRTGDRGVLLADGQVEFRGRIDGQEKILGQRVELDEITSVLSLHPKVEASVVVALASGSTDKVLVAYVIAAKGSAPTSRELQEHLSQSLPAFMVPSVFARIDALPLSYNGKIDRSALKPPETNDLLPAAATRAPRSTVEERLLAMVQSLLGTEEVAVEDDFFLVGGHSLLGTQLVLRTRAVFAIELSLRDLFEARTVERLAIKVEERLAEQLGGLSDDEVLRQMEASR